MGYQIEAYIENSLDYLDICDYNSASTPGRKVRSFPSWCWQTETLLGGSESAQVGYQDPPIYLFFWSTWKTMNYLDFGVQIFYTPKDGGAEVDGGKSYATINMFDGPLSIGDDEWLFNTKGYYWSVELSALMGKLASASDCTFDEVALAVGDFYDDRLADRYRIQIYIKEHWTDGKWYTYGPWTLYILYVPPNPTDAKIGNVDESSIYVSTSVGGWLSYANSWELGGLDGDDVINGGHCEVWPKNPKSDFVPTTTRITNNQSGTGSEIILSAKKSDYEIMPTFTDGDTYGVWACLRTTDGRFIQYVFDAIAENIGELTPPWAKAIRNVDGSVTVYVETPSTASDANAASVQLNGAKYDFDTVTSKLYDVPTVVIQEDEITDLTGTVWIFNEEIELFTIGTNYEIDFTSSGGYPFSKIASSHVSTYDQLRYYDSIYDAYIPVYTVGGYGWTSETYQTITIIGGTDATNTEFINWLKENAVQTEGPNIHVCVAFEFPFAPRSDCSFIIYSESDWDKTAASSVSVSGSSGGLLSRCLTIMRPDGSNTLYALFNLQVSESPECDTVEVQLNGRTRPSVFWGESGKHDRSIKFDIPLNSPVESLIGTQKQQIEAWRRTPFDGYYFMFLPDGERVAVQISDLSIERNYLEDKTASVSFKAVEVDA